MLICTYKYLEAFKEATNKDDVPQCSGTGISQTTVDVSDGGMKKLVDGEYGSSCIYMTLHVYIYR